MKVSRRLKRVLVYAFGSLYLSGTGYYVSRLWLRRLGKFGEEPHPLEHWLGPLHLAAALAFLFVLGIIWGLHAGMAVKLRRHRASGWAFLVLMLSLLLSAVALVYAGEGPVARVARYHPWVGILLLPALALHWQPKRFAFPEFLVRMRAWPFAFRKREIL